MQASTKIETHPKVRRTHLQRKAYVYVRQSSFYQVEHYQQSKRRQYNFSQRARELGWPEEQIIIVDEDQGQSGALAHLRSGFGRIVTGVGQGEGGIVLSLEASRLARNSPDWHNLIYMCRFTDTLIGDEHGIYDPEDAMDRMILGLRGQMSEMELETSIHRMQQGRWEKAKRGEFLVYPPAGYDIDDADQMVITSDEAVRQAVETVFAKFGELANVSRVFAWWQDQGLNFPIRRFELRSKPVVWVKPAYRMFWVMLHHPIYAGGYVFGRSKRVRELVPEEPGRVRTRQVMVAREEWPVLILDHHPGYVSWEVFEANQQRMRENQQMRRRDGEVPSGPAREGWALLQGLVRCAHCGRQMHVSYGGSRPSAKSTRTLQYRCSLARQCYGGEECQLVGGKQINDVVVTAFLSVTKEAGPAAAQLAAATMAEEAAAQEKLWTLEIEKAEYEAERAFRQYDAVEPENRVVARTLERRWNSALEHVEMLKASAKQKQRTVRPLSEEEQRLAQRLGTDLETVWQAPTTTNQDRKQLLRCLIEEVQLKTEAEHYAVKIVWKGGATHEQTVRRRRRGENPFATSEDTVELVRKLATEFDDAQISRILAKQQRRTGKGNPFTAHSVAVLRNRNGIELFPRHKAKDPKEGPFTADEAAAQLDVASGTIHQWIREGLLPGKQIAPGAPWQIVITEEIRRKLKGTDSPAGWVGLTEAARRLGLPKQQVSYLVKRGKLDAVRVGVGKRACWRIDVNSTTCGRQTELSLPTDNPISKEA